MKIAFVGKGGSGKSTMTALFIRYLQQLGRDVVAIDADLNMNLANLLGTSFPPEKAMALPDVADAIRTYIKGDNARVSDIGKFLPSTPPAEGSNLVRSIQDPILQRFSVDAGRNTRLMTVGTYEADGIGQTCYHSHLFVAENLLSHVVATDFDLVCDMVAGTDAFAYSLHLQFDAIILIAEPTPESSEVCKQYMKLAEEAGIAPLVFLIGNKIMDDDDLSFIGSATGRKPIGWMPALPSLKKARQRGESVPEQIISGSVQTMLEAVDQIARKPAISSQQRLAMLQSLHRKLNQKQWVKLAYGDVDQQIDMSFNIETAA